jgi:hypothetical protein
MIFLELCLLRRFSCCCRCGSMLPNEFFFISPPESLFLGIFLGDSGGFDAKQVTAVTATCFNDDAVAAAVTVAVI